MQRLAKRFGYLLVPMEAIGAYGEINWSKSDPGARDRYLEIQKSASSNKFSMAWAKSDTCTEIVDVLRSVGLKTDSILCHGVRNGSELDYFKAQGFKFALGTDLFLDPEATRTDIIEHDFSATNSDWLGQFDIVYSNSIDHALDPVATLLVWADQLKRNGAVILELDKSHGLGGTSDLDIFGIPLNVIPFWILAETGNRLCVESVHPIGRERSLFVIKVRYD